MNRYAPGEIEALSEAARHVAVEWAGADEEAADTLAFQFAETLRRAAPPSPNGSRASTRILSEVEPERVRWLWPGRIPLGRLTVLDGDPGLGKSTVTLDLAARVSTGAAMPDGSQGMDGPRGVVLLGGEDGLADTIRPRLDAAGADPTRVVALLGVVDRDDDGTPRTRLATVLDVDAIEEAAREVDAALLIIDPLSAYLGGADSHKDAAVRQALADLAALAERTGLAVLVIRHLTKSGAGNPLYAGGGSIGIIAAARSGMLLARDPEVEDRLILARTKGNLAAPWASLALRMDVQGEVVRMEWLGESERSAHDLLAREDGEARSSREEAEEWLRETLADGPQPSREVQREARADGITERTLRRAREALGVQVQKEGYGSSGRWVWTLPVKDGQGGWTSLENEEVDTFAGAQAAVGESPDQSSKGVHPHVLDTLGAEGPLEQAIAPPSDPGRHCTDCGAPVGPTTDRCARCRYPREDA